MLKGGRKEKRVLVRPWKRRGCDSYRELKFDGHAMLHEYQPVRHSVECERSQDYRRIYV